MERTLSSLILKLNSYSNIIIFGIGMVGQAVLEFCQKQNINISYIAIERMSVGPSEVANIPSRRKGGMKSFSETDLMMDNEIYGIPIKRIDTLSDNSKSALVLVADEENKQDHYVKLLQQYGFSNVYLISERLFQKICEATYKTSDLYKKYWELQNTAINELQLLRNCVRRQLKPTIFDFHFEFHIVEHCNLRCMGCTHFAPLAKNEFLEIEEFEKDISRLSFLTGGNACFINLLGGEPLLHPAIQKFLYVARRYFPDTIIRIVTNGILLGQQDTNLWEACRENNVSIGITEYPINIDYKAIKDIVSRENVDVISFSGGGVRDEMWKLSFDEDGKHRPMDNFMRCPRANVCVFCSHGKIYSCATMANIKHFNNYFGKKLELCEADYIDIYKVNSISEILEYLRNPIPFCRYCNIDQRTYGNKWRPSEKRIEEWM